MNINRRSMSSQHHHSYKIGGIALSCDIDTTQETNAEAERAASTLKAGDPAFVRRSDRIWRYAVVQEVSSSPPSILFVVTEEGSTKKVGPHHWGDRVRPFRPRGRPSTRPSGDADRSANPQAGSREPHVLEEKSSDDGTTDNEHPHQEPPRQRRTKRRGSLKDLVIKFSGSGNRNGDGGEINRLAGDDFDRAPDDMKVHEFDVKIPADTDIEVPQEDNESPKKPAAATKAKDDKGRRRKPTSRQAKSNFALTTSGLFKNLMKTAIVGDDAEAPKAARRRRATTEDVAADEDEDSGKGALEADDDDVAPMPERRRNKNGKPKRNPRRRATVECGRPSTKDLSSRRYHSGRKMTKAGGSADASPSASFVVKSAFSQLMEEKGQLRTSQLRDQEDLE